MGSLGDAQMNAVLDSIFGSGSPASYDVGLSTTQPTDAGTGVTEPVGGSYARVTVTNDATHFPAAAARTKSNGVAITFPAPSGPWGLCGWFVVYNHAGGAFVGWGALAVARNIDATSAPPSFAPGTLVASGPA